jgi:hypothetical protein
MNMGSKLRWSLDALHGRRHFTGGRCSRQGERVATVDEIDMEAAALRLRGMAHRIPVLTGRTLGRGNRTHQEEKLRCGVVFWQLRVLPVAELGDECRSDATMALARSESGASSPYGSMSPACSRRLSAS